MAPVRAWKEDARSYDTYQLTRFRNHALGVRLGSDTGQYRNLEGATGTQYQNMKAIEDRDRPDVHGQDAKYTLQWLLNHEKPFLGLTSGVRVRCGFPS